MFSKDSVDKIFSIPILATEVQDAHLRRDIPKARNSQLSKHINDYSIGSVPRNISGIGFCELILVPPGLKHLYGRYFGMLLLQKSLLLEEF